MKILWLSWKSTGHPEAGGAELLDHEICKRVIADGHRVTLLTSKPLVNKREKELNNLEIIRVGQNRYFQPLLALIYYLFHLRNKYDIVIEEINGGAPYFVTFFGRKAKRFVLYYQLARRNWLYEIRAPFSFLGYYFLVPAATWLLSLANVPVITESESTSKDLQKFGFDKKLIHIISVGIATQPVVNLDKIRKYTEPTILSHGSMRAMKRTLEQVKAFEIAKAQIPNLKMKISGDASGKYGKAVMNYIATSPFAKDIEYVGKTSEQQKIELMKKCHIILVTSVEEGWGLIVTEANSQGTPAVVYDVNGLRDSVRTNETGLITKATPPALASGFVSLLRDHEQYAEFRHHAWLWSKEITFERSYQDFKKVILS